MHKTEDGQRQQIRVIVSVNYKKKKNTKETKGQKVTEKGRNVSTSRNYCRTMGLLIKTVFLVMSSDYPHNFHFTLRVLCLSSVGGNDPPSAQLMNNDPEACMVRGGLSGEFQVTPLL